MHRQRTHYLKQYLCYQYAPLLKQSYQPFSTKSLSIPPSPSPSPSSSPSSCLTSLPHFITDVHSQPQTHYILKHRQTPTATLIDIFIYNRSEDSCYRLECKGRPTAVAIVKGVVYLLGGGVMYVMAYGDSNGDGCKVYQVWGNGDTVHAVQPGIMGLGNCKEETGVFVYLWNQKSGYIKKFYSNEVQIKDNWWQSTLKPTLLLKSAPKSLQSSTLKPIIPNILGLVLNSNLCTFSILNLSTMSPIPHLSLQLTSWSVSNPSKCLLRHYFNIKSQQFDDSLLIAMGEGERIEIFVLHIKYRDEVIKGWRQGGYKEDLSIRNVGNAGIVDWGACRIQSYVSFVVDGRIIDFLLLEKGILYYSRSSNNIPIANFISYRNPLQIHPILPLQHRIASSYISDIQQPPIPTQSTSPPPILSSLLIPNRYTSTFLSSTLTLDQPLSQIPLEQIKPFQLLSQWKKKYKIYGLGLVNGDVVVYRDGGMGTLMPICEEQFKAEWQDGDQFVRILKVNRGVGQEGEGEEDDGRLSVSEDMDVQIQIRDGQLKDNWWQQFKQINKFPFTYQRPYIQNPQVPNSPSSKLSQTISTFLSKLFPLMSSSLSSSSFSSSAYYPSTKITSSWLHPLHHEQSITNKNINFASMLIVNRVKDVIQFYGKYCRFLYFKAGQVPDQSGSASGSARDEKIFVKYLWFLVKLLENGFQQQTAHGRGLIDMFVVQQINQLFNSLKQQNGEIPNNTIIDIQKQSYKILYLFFKQIIPSLSTQSPQPNPFLSQLLTHLSHGFNYIQDLLIQLLSPMDILPLPSSSTSMSQPLAEQSMFPLNGSTLALYGSLGLGQGQLQGQEGQAEAELEGEARQLARIVGAAAIGGVAIEDVVGGMAVNKYVKDCIRNVYARVGNDKQANDQYGKVKSSRSTENSKIKFDKSRGIVQLLKLMPQSQELEKYLNSLSIDELRHVFLFDDEQIFSQAMKYTISHPNINTNKIKKSAIQIFHEGKYTNQQMLCANVFKFRAYVHKLQAQLLKLAQLSKSNAVLTQSQLSSLKSQTLHLAQLTQHALKSIRRYHSTLYSNPHIITQFKPLDRTQTLQNRHQSQTAQESLASKSPQQLKQQRQAHANRQRNPSLEPEHPNNPNNEKSCNLLSNSYSLLHHLQMKREMEDFEETDQEVIQRVCGRMVGLGGLGLYGHMGDKGDKGDYGDSVVKSVLPTSAFLGLMINTLKNQKTNVLTISNIQSIAFHYLNLLLESQNPHNLVYMPTLKKLFSTKYLSQLILSTATLREKFKKLPLDEYGLKLRSFFAYSNDLMTQGLSLSNNSMLMSQSRSDRSFQNRSQSKSKKDRERDREGERERDRDRQRERERERERDKDGEDIADVYRRMGFRNCYIQVGMGK